EAVELVVISDRLLVQCGDEGASVQLDGHPAAALQGDERLPDRDAADPEVLGQLVLGHALAGAQLALEDQPPDVQRSVGTATASGEPWRGRGAGHCPPERLRTFAMVHIVSTWVTGARL